MAALAAAQVPLRQLRLCYGAVAPGESFVVLGILRRACLVPQDWLHSDTYACGTASLCGNPRLDSQAVSSFLLAPGCWSKLIAPSLVNDSQQ